MAVIDAGSAPLPGIKPPSWLLALTEGGRAVADYVSLQGASPLLGYAPSGDGHPVMVLPGFLAAGGTTAPIRRFLVSKGYETFCWGLGRNLGPLAIGPEGELLGQRLESIHRKMKRKISLVGWSLGGVMARELAKRYPQYVRQVISLGSPFGGNPRANHAWRIYEGLTGQEINPKAMADAFESSADEPLAERLMRAVEAARDAGGQPEGQNSAALLVHGAEPFPLVDLRVDLHDRPEAELRRLWDWFRPMVPYYVQRALTPTVPRWWQWRMDHVPGWRARHLGRPD
jgi:pimeloyl-ACP methyl ester carboxylesterase